MAQTWSLNRKPVDGTPHIYIYIYLCVCNYLFMRVSGLGFGPDLFARHCCKPEELQLAALSRAGKVLKQI